jgi:hypothetical protein
LNEQEPEQETTMTTTIEFMGQRADRLVNILLASHKVQDDDAAGPLADALRAMGEIEAEKGEPLQDYQALICWEGMTWLVDDNNAFTRVYDPADADEGVVAELRGEEEDEDEDEDEEIADK